MTIADGNRVNNFDTLRLTLAVLVIFSHAFSLARGSNATEPLFSLTHGQTTLGEVSVWGFFAISGFLITQSWLRTPSPSKFLKRRVGRIYPGFLVLSLISAFVIIPVASDSHAFPNLSFIDITDTLRLQQFQSPPVFSQNPGTTLNGSLWSIPYEFWCYLGVLCLGICGILTKRNFLVLVFICTIAAHVYLQVTGWIPGGGLLGKIVGSPLGWTIVLPYFLAGMLFNLFGGRILIRTSRMLLALTLLVASYFVPHGVAIAMPICGSYLLLGLAYLPALNRLNLGRYGDFSYGVYLYAFPIEQLLIMNAGGAHNPLGFVCRSDTTNPGFRDAFLVSR